MAYNSFFWRADKQPSAVIRNIMCFYAPLFLNMLSIFIFIKNILLSFSLPLPSFMPAQTRVIGEKQSFFWHCSCFALAWGDVVSSSKIQRSNVLLRYLIAGWRFLSGPIRNPPETQHAASQGWKDEK